MYKIDPEQFGLSKKTIIEKENNNYYIVINRKSRIVMKDAESILEKAARIIKFAETAEIEVKTTAPVCSKTKIYLNSKGIKI